MSKITAPRIHVLIVNETPVVRMFGQNVRQWMRVQGVSIAELARRMGVTQKYIRQIREEGVQGYSLWDLLTGEHPSEAGRMIGLGGLTPRIRAALRQWVKHNQWVASLRFVDWCATTPVGRVSIVSAPSFVALAK